MPVDAGRARPWSLAWRITLVVSLTMAAVFTLSAWLVSRSAESHFEEMDLGELRAVNHSLRRALGEMPQREDRSTLRDRLAQAVSGHHGVYFGVIDGEGRSIYASAPQALLDAAQGAAAASDLTRDSLRVWTLGPNTYRGSVISVVDERVLVAVSTDAHVHYLAVLRRGLWWGALAATSLAMLAVCLAVRWGHEPIRRMSATVRGITSEKLHVRLDRQAVPPELSTLVESFNTMLDELQASFERLSHFSADIAHELRTPVTNLMTQTQVALSKDRPAAAYREVLYTGLDELDRMRKMIGDMLFLAQAEDPRLRLDKVAVDLEVEVRAVFEYFEAWADEAGVELRLDRTRCGRAGVRGDRGMLQRAIGNLVGNALRHAARGGGIDVRLVDDGPTVRVEVENSGAPIAPEHLPHLFDRFYRVDPARHREGEGAGLGLAIVKAIAEAHGGSVGAASESGCNRFWLCIPASADARRRAA